MASKHDEDLVERVAEQMRRLFFTTRPSMDAVARYALDLAERAAWLGIQSEAPTSAEHFGEIAKRTVRNAVEGA